MEIMPLEEIQSELNKLQSESDIVFAYPIYYSDLPKIVREFIDDNKNIWKDKMSLLLRLWDFSAVTGLDWLQGG